MTGGGRTAVPTTTTGVFFDFLRLFVRADEESAEPIRNQADSPAAEGCGAVAGRRRMQREEKGVGGVEG